MNLGSLIDTLKIHKPDASVIISAPVHLIPGEVMSYRGYYEQLAIEPLPDSDKTVTVESFLKVLEGAVGKTFTG